MMERRPAGESALELPVIGVGCMAFASGISWGPTEERSIKQTVDRAVEAGMNYFDTAEAYEGGRCEIELGRALRGIPREDVLIGSKVSPHHIYPEKLTAHCEASLSRLGTEYLDLYMIHWPPNLSSLRFFTKDESVHAHPPELNEAADVLLDLQRQGKIRHIGVSNFSISWLEKIQMAGVKPAINQLPYSLLSRAIEYELLPYCRNSGIGIIAYSPLLQGLLADRYETLDAVPEWQARSRHFNHERSQLIRHGEEGAEAETEQALREIRELVAETGMPMHQIALRWVVENPAITCAIAGARTPERVDQNASAGTGPLPADVMERLERITRPVLEKLGTAVDPYEHHTNDRTT